MWRSWNVRSEQMKPEVIQHRVKPSIYVLVAGAFVVFGLAMAPRIGAGQQKPDQEPKEKSPQPEEKALQPAQKAPPGQEKPDQEPKEKPPQPAEKALQPAEKATRPAQKARQPEARQPAPATSRREARVERRDATNAK